MAHKIVSVHATQIPTSSSHHPHPPPPDPRRVQSHQKNNLPPPSPVGSKKYAVDVALRTTYSVRGNRVDHGDRGEWCCRRRWMTSFRGDCGMGGSGCWLGLIGDGGRNGGRRRLTVGRRHWDSRGSCLLRLPEHRLGVLRRLRSGAVRLCRRPRPRRGVFWVRGRDRVWWGRDADAACPSYREDMYFAVLMDVLTQALCRVCAIATYRDRLAYGKFVTRRILSGPCDECGPMWCAGGYDDNRTIGMAGPRFL